MRLAQLSAAVFALPLIACAADSGSSDEGWRPDGKADGNGVTLSFASYDVLFTNPLCREYTYATPVESADGSTMLTAKPKNVFCSHTDIAASAARPESPQNKLLTWLKPLTAGDEVFLAYLSFSNAAIGDELCAASQRGVKVTFVLDARSPQADRLEQCGGTILLRGHSGSIGYAHNKVILINPKGTSPFMKMTFSSGNMSSGVVTHHENWHFIDVKRESYFAQAHVCLMEAQLSTTASASKAAYRDYLNTCRGKITAKEEDDIKAFFVPSSDDRQRAERYMLGAIEDASNMDIGVHRFGHTGLVTKLREQLDAGQLAVRMVADDDLYWLDPEAGTSAKIGDNDYFEADNVRSLEEAGGDNYEIRYFQTNHGEHLLHHNKYLIYRDDNAKPFGLVAGAANLTKTGFTDNFENIYFIKIPKVLEAFDTQFARVWDGEKANPSEQDPPIATPRNLMPAMDVAPQ
jgi:hypothetical protein